jgi:hypothetical protein
MLRASLSLHFIGQHAGIVNLRPPCHRIAQESVSFQPNILPELLQSNDLMPPFM